MLHTAQDIKHFKKYFSLVTLNAFILLSQLNIVNDKMYEVLSDIYQEYLQLFDTDVFHMGGDEVNMNCYNTSAEIRRHLELHGKQVLFLCN